MRGPTGRFADLNAQRRSAIPMEVLLPTGGPVRATISGTDVDGVREVDGIVAAHEYKAAGSAPVTKGQLRALRSFGNFFIGSRWLYRDRPDIARSEAEELAAEHGYECYAVPVSAVIWGHGADEHRWLYRYLRDVGFNPTLGGTRGYGITFSHPEKASETHIFRPTDEWKKIAFIPDFYSLSLKADNLFPLV